MGEGLFAARRRRGLSQEAAAEALGVSRQTISKWELGETLPDIRQAKRLAKLYQLTLDELVDFDVDLQGIMDKIRRVDETKEAQVDWSSAWSVKYPVLTAWPELPGTDKYVERLGEICRQLKREYGFSELDGFLVVKDMLYRIYCKNKNKHKKK